MKATQRPSVNPIPAPFLSEITFKELEQYVAELNST